MQTEIRRFADPVRAGNLARFFQTGKGQYGFGDRFLGLTVPQSRKLAKRFRAASLSEIRLLLASPFHEERLIALLILVDQFAKGTDKKREQIVRLYLRSTKRINNWDLVDLSAHKIVGPYLSDQPRDLLVRLAHSDLLWDRRIAVLSTFYFIGKHEFDDALKIADLLLHDKHDLIQKAVGWMLREIGKRSVKTLEDFLLSRYSTMPRTTLRYAIERFPEARRQAYLKGRV